MRSVSQNGSTSLLYAASRDRIPIAKLLIESGADVNRRDKLGSTALHRAASRGHNEMVQLLLGVKTIEIDAYDNEKNTPLSVFSVLHVNIDSPIIYSPCQRVIAIFFFYYLLLFFHNSHMACEEERNDVCRLLIAAGASVSAQNKVCLPLFSFPSIPQFTSCTPTD